MSNIYMLSSALFILTGRACNGNVSVSAPTVVAVTGGADPFIRGDINGDREITLADAIIALQLTGGLPPAGQIINPRSDINNDGKIGLAEAIYIIQKTADLR